MGDDAAIAQTIGKRIIAYISHTPFDIRFFEKSRLSSYFHQAQTAFCKPMAPGDTTAQHLYLGGIGTGQIAMERSRTAVGAWKATRPGWFPSVDMGVRKSGLLMHVLRGSNALVAAPGSIIAGSTFYTPANATVTLGSTVASSASRPIKLLSTCELSHCR